MIPVPGLDQVRIAWIEIRAQGYILYGFMLYSDADTPLVNYMQSGLVEIDALSGAECAIFVIESPSAKWIEFTRRKDHPWWRLFGRYLQATSGQSSKEFDSISNKLVRELLKYQQAVIVQVADAQLVTLQHLFAPDYQLLYDRSEVWSVAKEFGIKPEDVPCLIFFHDLDDDEDVTIVDLTDLRTERQATRYFRRFFGSREFKKILREARAHA
ncbi:MAG: hypothetical protein AABM67_20020 [Acidobacteriota bacterium]